MKLWNFAAVLGAVAVAASAHAQEVVFTFSGQVYQAGSATNDAFGLSVPVGTLFSGTFHYDVSTAPFSSGSTAEGESAAYLDGALTVTLAGLTVTTVLPAQLTVNDNAYVGYDSFSVAGFPPGLAVTGTSFLAEAFFVGFNDATGTAFASTALPPVLGSEFNDNGFGLQFTNGRDAYSIYGVITSLQPVAPVPEPASIALMLGGLGLIGRRLVRHGLPRRDFA